VRSTI